MYDLKITVVGPGAVGCLLAHGLHTAGYAVTLLDYRSDRAARISKNGIRAMSHDAMTVSKLRCSADASELPVQDVTIFTVKAYQSANAARAASPIVGRETVVLTLQNGMGYEHVYSGISDSGTVAVGTTALGATLLKEGVVRMAGTGPTVMGFLGDVSACQKEILFELASAFDRAGWECHVVENPEFSRWNKLMANIGINAITAASCLRNGEILKFDDASRLQESVVKEAFGVMKHRFKDVTLSFDNVIERVRKITRCTSENCSSMLQDRMKRSMTEIDYINGYICREGERVGLPTPINETLWRIIRLLSESGWRTC